MSSIALTADAAHAAEVLAEQVESELPAKIRLHRSRERLRMAMRRDAGLEPPERAPVGAPGWANGIFTIARSIPGADVVTDVLRRWWANHPLRTAALVAHDAAENLAAPMARRHPLALMAGALFTGALLAKLRPWRWLPRTLMFAGLVPQLVSRLVASVPLDTWLSALTHHAAPSRSPNTSAREAARRPG